MCIRDRDGDKVRISPILSYSEQTVYLDGHVVNPGKRAYREGMRVTDLIRSYTDLLPEPASGHAEIIRLAAPDFAPYVIAFNLADALAANKPVAGNAQDLLLKPFDTVRIFGRFDFEDPPAVSYTHLDVYKRQEYDQALPPDAGSLPRVSPEAVSYTHLDVYKRQVAHSG